MVVGVPNVGKSALINSIHQIASSRFPGELFVGSGVFFLGITILCGKLVVLDELSFEDIIDPNLI